MSSLNVCNSFEVSTLGVSSRGCSINELVSEMAISVSLINANICVRLRVCLFAPGVTHQGHAGIRVYEAYGAIRRARR